MKENQEFEDQLDENLSEDEQELTEATDQPGVEEVVEELTTEQELEKKIDELTKALEE